MPNNYLGMGAKVRAPAGSTKADVKKMVGDIVKGRRQELPDGWEITLRWQNKRGGQWRTGELLDTIRGSRSSWLTAVRTFFKVDQ